MNNHLDLGSIESVIDAALAKCTKTINRMAAYRLPIQKGRITFSAMDPKGDGSERAWKTSFMWGPKQGDNVKSEEHLQSKVYPVTMKFTPFKVTKDGRIHSGGFMPEQTFRMVCNNCSAPFEMTYTARQVVHNKGKDFCEGCANKKVSKSKCRLKEAEVLPCPTDDTLLHPMYAMMEESIEPNLAAFTPQVYGVFHRGEAPGSVTSWSEQEEELVERYSDISMEVRPLKFLKDIYTKNKNGKTVWKSGVKNLQNLVVSGNPINIAWLSEEDSSGWPFKLSKAADWRLMFPKPNKMTVV